MSKKMTKINLYTKDIFENRNEKGNIIIPDINFDFESREKMGNDMRIKNWIKTQDQREYLIKTNAKLEEKDNYLNIAELICEQICKEFGIDYADYDTILFNGENGVIVSNIVGNNQELITLEDLLEGAIAHPDNSEIIDYNFMINTLTKNLKKYKYANDVIEKIKVELGKRLLIDIIVGATDRHTENISFIYNNKTEELQLAPVYDSENSLLLEYEVELIDTLAKNLRSAIESAQNIYPKIAVVPRKNSNSKEIIQGSIEFIINNENPEVEDFAYNLLDNLDIYKIMDNVEKKINAKLSSEIRAVVSTCIETRLKYLNDVLNDGVFVPYDWDYMNQMQEKMKNTVQSVDKEIGKYEVLYQEKKIGEYIIHNDKDMYLPNIEEIEKLNIKVFPMLREKIESKDITFFSRRIQNCNRFGGIIGYQTDNIELKKIE